MIYFFRIYGILKIKCETEAFLYKAYFVQKIVETNKGQLELIRENWLFFKKNSVSY